ncbi:MAG: hypothetical protein QOH12_3098 [Solirubrobacteraceae bacterium]|jgi:uncharacterized protein (DUF1015 family)|nr:hypothetical protein [Solirubrobacteraceae bacterium]
MAELKPLKALHYDPAVAGDLADLVAPPYDVIDADQREALVARSPFNVVGIDLPLGDDRYTDAAALLEHWKSEGVLTTDSDDALWALTQDYTGPDGDARTRRGFFARVRVTEYGPGRIRPHERTHPGPKEDRLRLTRATQANLSPIFSLYSDPDNLAWTALEPHTTGAPWGEVTDADGTLHRIWRVADPDAVAKATEALADTELLIADGHHRYETARVYAEEIGGEGPHRYVLMCLVALEDPGLTVFPTHRLVRGLDSARQEALGQAIKDDFEIARVTRDEIAPPPGGGPLELGYIDSHFRQPYRLTLKSQEIADAALPEMSDAYRRLDVGVLEALLLKRALGLTDDDISHLNGFGYARDVDQALDLIDSKAYDAAFLVRPTPVEQVREIAATGQNMPPKSTYFFPKVLTGLVFNPLA